MIWQDYALIVFYLFGVQLNYEMHKIVFLAHMEEGTLPDQELFTDEENDNINTFVGVAVSLFWFISIAVFLVRKAFR